jgi:hypothetical protein
VAEQRQAADAYSVERKDAILRRMMPPENRSMVAFAGENGFTEQTLYTSRRHVKVQAIPVPGVVVEFVPAPR